MTANKSVYLAVIFYLSRVVPRDKSTMDTSDIFDSEMDESEAKAESSEPKSSSSSEETPKAASRRGSLPASSTEKKKKTSSKSSPPSGQRSIKSMFAAAATNKRKLSNDEEKGNEEKKIKTDEVKKDTEVTAEKKEKANGEAEEDEKAVKKETEEESAGKKDDGAGKSEEDAVKEDAAAAESKFKPPETIAKATAKVDKSPPKRCNQCRAILDNNPNLKIRENEPIDGVEEMIALTDDKLAVEGMDGEDRVTNLVTAYSIFDKNDHLVDFSTGLIEKNVELYFNGYLKPLIADNPASIEGGVPVVKVGPIHEWWSTGFDKDSVPTIGKEGGMEFLLTLSVLFVS